jgi:hypothetical protein
MDFPNFFKAYHVPIMFISNVRMVGNLIMSPKVVILVVPMIVSHAWWLFSLHWSPTRVGWWLDPQRRFQKFGRRRAPKAPSPPPPLMACMLHYAYTIESRIDIWLVVLRCQVKNLWDGLESWHWKWTPPTHYKLRCFVHGVSSIMHNSFIIHETMFLSSQESRVSSVMSVHEYSYNWDIRKVRKRHHQYPEFGHTRGEIQKHPAKESTLAFNGGRGRTQENHQNTINFDGFLSFTLSFYFSWAPPLLLHRFSLLLPLQLLLWFLSNLEH